MLERPGGGLPGRVRITGSDLRLRQVDEDDGVRTARIERATKESKVLVELDLDGSGRADVSTGVGFYDHMLNALARHSLVDLTVQADGDLHIDGDSRPVLASVKHFAGDGGTSWASTSRYSWIPGWWQSEAPDRWQIDQGNTEVD